MTVPKAVLFEDTSKSDASTFTTASLNVTRNTGSVLEVRSCVGSYLSNNSIDGNVLSTIYDSSLPGVVLISGLGVSALSTML